MRKEIVISEKLSKQIIDWVNSLGSEDLERELKRMELETKTMHRLAENQPTSCTIGS